MGESLPVWGEWIEISDIYALSTIRKSLSPCGESGLKYNHNSNLKIIKTSLPVWGEWIEIRDSKSANANLMVSPRVGRVD